MFKVVYNLSEAQYEDYHLKPASKKVPSLQSRVHLTVLLNHQPIKCVRKVHSPFSLEQLVFDESEVIGDRTRAPRSHQRLPHVDAVVLRLVAAGAFN